MHATAHGTCRVVGWCMNDHDLMGSRLHVKKCMQCTDISYIYYVNILYTSINVYTDHGAEHIVYLIDLN